MASTLHNSEKALQIIQELGFELAAEGESRLFL